MALPDIEAKVTKLPCHIILYLHHKGLHGWAPKPHLAVCGGGGSTEFWSSGQSEYSEGWERKALVRILGSDLRPQKG